MKRLSKILVVSLILILAFTAFALTGCNDKESKVVRVSTTTSVNDSGLMNYLAPHFEEDTGYKWEIASAGTGAAIASATYGNADVILVHSKSAEETFVNDGFGKVVDGYSGERVSFMYNYFVLVGPTTASANVTDAESVKAVFNEIYTNNYLFVSRGDKSGTHNAEIKLWPAAMAELFDGGKITNDVTKIPASILYGDNNKDGFYISAGLGMGACLTMANEKGAYCLTDKATFLSYKKDAGGDKLPNLKIIYEQDDAMKNTYSIIAVNPEAKFISSTDSSELPAGSVKIDTKAADVFTTWMTGTHASELIAEYGKVEYGEQLFYLQSGYKAG